MKKLTAIVLGYGMRGQGYTHYSVNHPDELQIVAVADPVENKRNYAQERHNIPDDMLFSDWKDLIALPKMADFALVSTQDKYHLEPALACIEKGYNLLLEKPMAPTAKECKIIYEAAEKKGVKVIVCHVLRFTKFWYKLKDIIDDGILGDLMSIIHMENVGHLHYSHSYTRGNWRNCAESSPMILAKSCHDIDILQWLVGKDCKKVHSFGSLTHFRKENKPEGAPARCLDGCPHQATCPYDPVRFYVTGKKTGWEEVVANKVKPSDEEIMEALEKGPYGRCVYECDNDVVDHQVVNMEFDGGCTVSFTMSAFNEGGRFVRIFGTKGELVADMKSNVIDIFHFNTKEHEIIELNKQDESIFGGHGGGDTGIVIDALKYFGDETPSKSVCDLRTSYLNHITCFAAEESRLSGKVIDVQKFSDEI